MSTSSLLAIEHHVTMWSTC